ncbi:hypothetical protein ACWEQL_27775 [Kitasatospora sp. NPDC004240]
MSEDHITRRMTAPLEFKLVDSPPEYNGTTDKLVEYYLTYFEDRYPTGLLWVCDEDDAAGYEWWRELPNENAAVFWYGKLRGAKARGLKPSEAVRELMAEPGTLLSGRILPGSRTKADRLADVIELARNGTPLREATRPDGWRPDPPVGPAQAEAARANGGWVYQVDEGHDPAGRVPGHAVVGAWQSDPDGRPVRFWHNPRHGATPEPAAAPMLPLGAGRRPAGRALLDWLEDPRAPRLCRIAGSFGSGRTHLLAWLAATCPPDNRNPDRRVDAVLAAEGLTVRSATWRLASLLKVLARTPDDLVAALQDGVTRTVAVTDLDRAGGGLVPDAAERIAAEVLAPLARIPWLRLVVECASGRPAAAALHAADPRAAVLDLDDPRWTDRDRFAEWCAGLDGAPVDPQAVYPNPGLALLAARTPASATPGGPAGALQDPATAGSAAVPADRASAVLADWWRSLPHDELAAVRTLSQAGRPLTPTVWAALPGSGGTETVRRAAARLLPPAAGAFSGDAQALLRPVPQVGHVPAVDHAALAQATAASIPVLDDGRPDLAAADPVVLSVLLQHTVQTDFADQLLNHPVVHAHADPDVVTAAFEHARARGIAGEGTGPAVYADAWDLAGPACTDSVSAPERASVLHAHLSGHAPTSVAHMLVAVSGQAWWAKWSHRTGGEQVRLLADGRGSHAGGLVVATDGAVRFLDPHHGGLVEGVEPLPLPGGRHAALLVEDDGTLVLLGRDGAVATVPATGSPSGRVGAVLDDLTRRSNCGLTAAACAEGNDGRVLAIGDDAGHVSHTLTAGGRLYTKKLHRGPVTALALAPTAGGLLQVSGGDDGTVWHWYHRGLEPSCIDARYSAVTAVAATDTPHGILTATAWSDGLLRMHRPTNDNPVDLYLGRPITALTATPDGQIHIALPEAVLALRLRGWSTN